MFLVRALQLIGGVGQPQPVDTAAPLVAVLNDELAVKDQVLYNIYEEAFGAMQLLQGTAFTPADLGIKYTESLKYIVQQLQTLFEFDPRYNTDDKGEANPTT
jgi:hypothetical protein